ncbi:endolytic transglycosylase MltG [Streptomyces sp. P38-E01]|uniref:Endolytic murein transglycosylase n=1 Tax=Streptomyces tardus TaxID=2780544 RepID=A0A949N7J5_9ACTN|nr:endolytic transglycosylase MltG [Streptomyces tardus]MBU7597048.1 endolytic transglycosylase MltG [Streptomyces tardus]
MGKRGLIRAALLCVLILLAVLIVTQLVTRDRDPAPREERLTVPEGWRASQVYAAGDKALGLDRGSTERAARKSKLKLPAEADGNPEGYLFPATYPVTEDSGVRSLLSFMVNTANSTFAETGLSEAAERSGLSVYETVALASIVQAEADTPEDMGRVARVVHNRLEQDMALQMDSTLNYALKRSSLDTSHGDTRIDSPYNTYQRRGLPPTPIGNPGPDALRAVARPPEGDWLYFVTVRPGDTRFTSDHAEHERNVEEFNRVQREDGSGS